MKAITSRSVSIATAAERSSRIVCWNDRRISTTRSALLSRIRLCSAFSNVSCNITTTTSSRIEVRALVGPRPVYSWTIRTTAREIDASRGPSVWCCSSGAIGTGFRTPQYRWAAREGEGVHEDPTRGNHTSDSAVGQPVVKCSTASSTGASQPATCSITGVSARRWELA